MIMYQFLKPAALLLLEKGRLVFDPKRIQDNLHPEIHLCIFPFILHLYSLNIVQSPRISQTTPRQAHASKRSG
mgnify:CR=1 FL=1